MGERPILFSGAMVRALLAGRKTQTRRVVKPGMYIWEGQSEDDCEHIYQHDQRFGEKCAKLVPCPYGAPGDRLWVRETFATPRRNKSVVWYRAGHVGVEPKWRPSIHMPRWASRLTLEVTGVRVERLQDISEADARAEGAQVVPFYPDDGFPLSDGWTHVGDDGKCVLYTSARDSFRALWESINGADSWASNPWVWAISFRRVTP